MKRFEIYYANSSIVRGDTDNEWYAAPSENIQAIVYLHDDGHAQEKIYGFDEYLLEDGKIVGADEELGEQAKRGSLISNEAYKAIIDSLEEQSLIWNK